MLKTHFEGEYATHDGGICMFLQDQKQFKSYFNSCTLPLFKQQIPVSERTGNACGLYIALKTAPEEKKKKKRGLLFKQWMHLKKSGSAHAYSTWGKRANPLHRCLLQISGSALLHRRGKRSQRCLLQAAEQCWTSQTPKQMSSCGLPMAEHRPGGCPYDALMMGLLRPVSTQSVRAKGLRAPSLAKSFEKSL